MEMQTYVYMWKKKSGDDVLFIFAICGRRFIQPMILILGVHCSGLDLYLLRVCIVASRCGQHKFLALSGIPAKSDIILLAMSEISPPNLASCCWLCLKYPCQI